MSWLMEKHVAKLAEWLIYIVFVKYSWIGVLVKE
jgi:hypothetical protein